MRYFFFALLFLPFCFLFFFLILRDHVLFQLTLAIRRLLSRVLEGISLHKTRTMATDAAPLAFHGMGMSG